MGCFCEEINLIFLYRKLLRNDGLIFVFLWNWFEKVVRKCCVIGW